MTTICTDRALPETLNDYGKENSLFSRIVDFATWKSYFHLTYNSGAYAKLAMGPFWVEIMDNIKLTYKIQNVEEEEREAPRMALYSGHDSTIIPLLASLGLMNENNLTWTPYASMLIIEIHAVQNQNDPDFPTQRAFRLLYNGDVLTSLLPGCPSSSELCDVQVLRELVRPFATRDRDCTTESKNPSGIQMAQITTLSGQTGWLKTLMVVTLTAVASALAMFMYLTGGFPCSSKGLQRERMALSGNLGGSTPNKDVTDWSPDTRDLDLL